ncbi:MAG TPA: hypothetical protein GXX40_06510 [Firmicutes bacterium]|nr:hypothetical protein [Bacillota bacterium]
MPINRASLGGSHQRVGRSLENGVTLVVMTYKDLSLYGTLKNLPAHLPKRPIDSALSRTSRQTTAAGPLIEGEMQGKLEAPSLAGESRIC